MDNRRSVRVYNELTTKTVWLDMKDKKLAFFGLSLVLASIVYFATQSLDAFYAIIGFFMLVWLLAFCDVRQEHSESKRQSRKG